MKSIILSVFIALLASSAWADEVPSWLSLPNDGANCVFESQFTDGTVDCGTKRFEVWNCIESSGTLFQSAQAKKYLIVGKYESDVSEDCSPTYVVEKTVPAGN